MRIVCPQCQTAYKVDLPDIDESGMEVKCAKCQNIFLVSKEDPTPKDSAASSSADTPPGKNLNKDPKDPDENQNIPLPKEYLEDLMDEFVQEEVSKEATTQSSKTDPPETSKDRGSSVDDTAQKKPDSLEDPVLDDMWEKALQTRSQKPKKDSDSEVLADQEKSEKNLNKPGDVKPAKAADEPATVQEAEEPKDSQVTASPTDAINEPDLTETLADQKETESRWKQAQEQDKALAEEDLQMAEEHEQSLEEQWTRAMSERESAKLSLEENLTREMIAEPESEKSSEPSASEETKNPEPPKVTAATTEPGSPGDSFDDDWMKTPAKQPDTELDAPPEKLETAPSTDAATPVELASEAETKNEEPSVKPTVPQTPEPAVGAVLDSNDALDTDKIWEEAFNEPASQEPALASHEDLKISEEKGEEDDGDPRPEPIVFGQDQGDKLFDAEEALKNYDESAYDDDDDDLFDYQPQKRSRGPFSIPSGAKGDWVIAGVVASLLLIVGGVYFAIETFAPEELTDVQVADTIVPEGLTPKNNLPDSPVETPAAPLTEEPDKSPAASEIPLEPGHVQPRVTLSDVTNSSSFEAGRGEQTLASEVAQSKILGDAEPNRFRRDNNGFNDVLASGSNSVTMSTIMPVAYNPTDIRVLSFSLEMQMSDAASARRVRDALPIYEKIMIDTVEEFLRRKFYDDVLYVKEKLQKRLLTAMNKSIQGGRVKKPNSPTSLFSSFQIYPKTKGLIFSPLGQKKSSGRLQIQQL